MQMRFAYGLLVAAFACAASPARAQPDAPAHPGGGPQLDALLDRISERAGDYRAHLPSLSAQEDIVSSAPGTGPFRKKAEARALFRMQHTSPAAPLEEARQIVEFNGRPVTPGVDTRLPTDFSGAFGEALGIFFAAEVRPCFVYTPGPPANGLQRIDFAAQPAGERPGHASDSACNSVPPGEKGYATVDVQTANIVRLERTVPEDEAAQRHIASFAAVDYAPAAIGASTFWLPAVVTARLRGDKFQFTAHYSHYQRFSASATILPGLAVPADEPK